jgi:hypothetical protein
MDISNIDIDSVQADWNMNHLARVRTTYVSHIEDITNNSIKFRGYFLYEPETMPIERILSISYKKNDAESERIDEDYHIRITSVEKDDVPFRCNACEKGEDCDPEEGHIQFFPNQIIQMRYEVIDKITSHDQMFSIVGKIKNDEEAVLLRDEENMLQRGQVEIREFNERCDAYRKEHGKSIWDK